jgi:hypothetical protein
MALPEPQRSDALAEAVTAGEVYTLRSASGEEIGHRYGERVITVSGKPKPFQAPHAIHLLWYLGDRIEEVDEEE